VFGDRTNGRTQPRAVPHGGPANHQSSTGDAAFEESQEWRRQASGGRAKSSKVSLVVGVLVVLMVAGAGTVGLLKYTGQLDKTEPANEVATSDKVAPPQQGDTQTAPEPVTPASDSDATPQSDPTNEVSQVKAEDGGNGATVNPETTTTRKETEPEKTQQTEPKPEKPKPKPKPKPDTNPTAETRLVPSEGASFDKPFDLVIDADVGLKPKPDGYLPVKADSITVYGPIMAYVKKSTGRSNTISFKEAQPASGVVYDLGSLTIHENSRRLELDFKGVPLTAKKVARALLLSCIQVSSSDGTSECFVIDLDRKRAKDFIEQTGWNRGKIWVAVDDRKLISNFMKSDSGKGSTFTFIMKPIALQITKPGARIPMAALGKMSRVGNTWTLDDFPYDLSGFRTTGKEPGWAKIEISSTPGSKQLTALDIKQLQSMLETLRQVNTAPKLQLLATRGYVLAQPKGQETRTKQLEVFRRSGINRNPKEFNDNLSSKVMREQPSNWQEKYTRAINLLKANILTKLKTTVPSVDKKKIITAAPLKFEMVLEYKVDGVVARVPYRSPE
jgi:hypothetical protein